MTKHKVLGILICITALGIILACGGSSDDVSSLLSSATTTAADTSSIEVSTQILAPQAESSSAIAKEAIAGEATAYTESVVTGATVTLVLADGTEFTMTDNGNGFYSTTVDLPKGSGFVIEARKGDLHLVNMFNDPVITGTQFDGGQTNASTTAFAEIVRNTLKQTLNDSNIDTADFATLMGKMEDATITVDWTQLKRDVTDEGNATYTSIVTTYTALLSQADQTASGNTSVLDQFRDGSGDFVVATSWNQIVTDLSSVTLPVINDDIAAIRTGFAAAKTAYDSGDLSTFAAFMAETYLENGYDKQHELVNLQQEWQEETQRNSNLELVDITFNDAKTIATARMVGTSTWTENNAIYTEKMYDEMMYFVKVSGLWKYNGNQQKSDIRWHLAIQKFEQSATSSTTTYRVGMEVEEAPASYPISSVTVAGPAGVNYTLTNTDDDEYWYSRDMYMEEELTRTPVVGDKYTFTVNYEDGTSETKVFTVMAVPALTAKFPVVTAPVTNATISGDTFTFSWTNVTAEHKFPRAYDIYLWTDAQNSSLFDRFGVGLDQSTLLFPTTGLKDGTYNVNCSLETRYYLIRFNKVITVGINPIPTP